MTEDKPKPICVVYYLPDLLTTNGEIKNVGHVNEALKNMFPDYYVLAVPSHQSADGSCEDIRLQVFYEKDFTEIQFQELQTLIINSINDLKQNTNG